MRLDLLGVSRSVMSTRPRQWPLRVIASAGNRLFLALAFLSILGSLVWAFLRKG